MCHIDQSHSFNNTATVSLIPKKNKWGGCVYKGMLSLEWSAVCYGTKQET